MVDDEELETEEPDMGGSGSRESAAGFAAGLVVGALLGAGIALLFAPDRGDRTRKRLSRRLRQLKEEGRGRGGRRLRARLERVAERARDRLR